MKPSPKQIREKLTETAVGYQMPEGLEDVIAIVADRLECPESRVRAFAYRMKFPE